MPLALEPGQSLVVATFNPGKVVEMHALLEGRFHLISAKDTGLTEPDETEVSFIGNAILKARHAANASGQIAIADDSGLSVTALDGAPGIYSARWAGPNKDFKHAMAEVEAQLEAINRALPERHSDHAWFTSVLAVAWPEGPVCAFEGRVDGRLVFPGRGTNGFGYDPIFVPDSHVISFAEMDPDAKHAMSHRARAFGQLTAALF